MKSLMATGKLGSSQDFLMMHVISEQRGKGGKALTTQATKSGIQPFFSRCLSFFLSTCRRSSDVIHINAPFNVFQAVDRPGLPLSPKARTFPASGLQGLKSPEKDREFREERGG